MHSSFPSFALLIKCELSIFIIKNQPKVSVAFTERARFSKSVSYTYYTYTPWTVYCLSMHFIRSACQSRYLESKFRFKYILNWWPRGQDTPLLLPRILKLIIHYIHIFVCHLKHIGLPNLEKFVQDQNILIPHRKKISGFALGNNLHLVLGLSSFYIRFSSHASRIFFFVYVCCYKK